MNKTEVTFKIAMFLPSLEVGGAERVFVSLANAFVSKGYQVDVVLVSARGPLLKHLKDEVDIVDFKKTRAISCSNSLRQYLNDSQPQVLFASLTHTNIIASLAVYFSKCKPYLMVREASLPELTLESGGAFRNYLMRKLVRSAYAKADSVICVSSKVREEYLIALSPSDRSKYVVVFNPIDPERVESSQQDSLVLEDIKTPFIVAVGRMVPEKGFDSLLKAFSRVRLSTDIGLCLIGDGPELNSLKKIAVDLKISDHVTFTGYLDQPNRLVRKAAVFVLSSSSEGLPNSLIEALSLHVPSVATDISSVAQDIISDSGIGVSVAPNSPEELAKGILTVLDNADCWKLNPDWQERFAIDEIVGTYTRLMGAPLVD